MLIFEETYEMHLAEFQAREQMSQTSRKSSAHRLDNLPMAVGLERVRKDMLERRRARLEQLSYIGTDMRSSSVAQSRANKTMFEETLSTGGCGREAVVRAAPRKCLPKFSRITGPTFYGSPLYNKRTRLMASIRARPSGWPPVPWFRGRAVVFDHDPMAKSPLDPTPPSHPMPDTVSVPLPIRRKASLKPIVSKYPVAMPAEDIKQEEEETVQPESPTAVSVQSSRNEAVVSNTVIADAAEDSVSPGAAQLAMAEVTAKLDTASEAGKRPSTKASEKSQRGRRKPPARRSPRGKAAAKAEEESIPTESVTQARAKPDNASVTEASDDEEEAPIFVHWVDTLTVSSVYEESDMGEETGSMLLDLEGDSERGSKQLSIDMPIGMLGLELQPSVIGVTLDKQQTDVDDRIVVEGVSPSAQDADQPDDRPCGVTVDRVVFLLPDFDCPNSEEKSKALLVKEWLSRCNMSYAKNTLPLL